MPVLLGELDPSLWILGEVDLGEVAPRVIGAGP